MRMLTSALFSGLLCAAPVCAQDASQAAEPSTTGPIVYPRDAARVIARVNGEDLTVEDMVGHIGRRHAPGFEKLLATPEGNAYFRAPQRFGADWVRQFADIRALRAEASARGLALADAEPFLSAALKKGFEDYLQAERRGGRLRGELDQKLLSIRLARYQQEFGLQTEVQGWLDFLVPEQTDDAVLREYFYGRARQFGGRVTFAHILIHNRDPVTLRLLDGEERKRAIEKVADVRARLAEDGSNFEDVAAGYSEDRKTASRGGVFRNVKRFDPRLPAILCRTAWQLEDGDVTGPVQSAYGLHFVKRISLVQTNFMIYAPNTKPVAVEQMRRDRQEDLLFGVRERLQVELRY